MNSCLLVRSSCYYMRTGRYQATTRTGRGPKGNRQAHPTGSNSCCTMNTPAQHTPPQGAAAYRCNLLENTIRLWHLRETTIFNS